MQKKGLIPLGLLLINVVSAASFSFGDAFDYVGRENLVLISIFAIIFALIYFALSRVIKDKLTGEPNKAIAGFISAGVALLGTLGVYEMEWDVENFFFDIGVPTEIFYIIIPFVVIGGLLFALAKFKFLRKYFLIILGGFFFTLGFLAYKKGALITIGIISIILGIIIRLKNGKKAYNSSKKWKFSKNKLKELQNKNKLREYKKELKKKDNLPKVNNRDYSHPPLTTNPEETAKKQKMVRHLKGLYIKKRNELRTLSPEKQDRAKIIKSELQEIERKIQKYQ